MRDKMNSDNFFKNLPSYDSINLLSKDIYTPMANDWYIMCTDIKGSTKAIENGQYKDINFLGALSIISLLNINKTIELPFIFGGDGAFILIPPSILNEAKQALVHIKDIALKNYKLDLRIAAIPIKKLFLDKKPLFIAKTKISKGYNQALFKGQGTQYADSLMKQNDTYTIKSIKDDSYSLKTEGLECRWNTIPSSKDFTLSLIITCKEHSYYEKVLKKIDLILGDKFHRHPIKKETLNLSFTTNTLATEAKLKSTNKLKQFLTILKFKFINLIGLFFLFFKIDKWTTYKQKIIDSSDTEKFDDSLRMVVVANQKQVEELNSYLHKEFKDKNLYYGIHKTYSALITCLIFERHGKHIHFVDSSDGGYAYAAKQLKKQISISKSL
jgi:hypothetical protein